LPRACWLRGRTPCWGRPLAASGSSSYSRATSRPRWSREALQTASHPCGVSRQVASWTWPALGGQIHETCTCLPLQAHADQTRKTTLRTAAYILPRTRAQHKHPRALREAGRGVEAQSSIHAQVDPDRPPTQAPRLGALVGCGVRLRAIAQADSCEQPRAEIARAGGRGLRNELVTARSPAKSSSASKFVRAAPDGRKFLRRESRTRHKTNSAGRFAASKATTQAA